MRKIRLIAADLDGTLLTEDKRLTERNRAALERAARSGIHIVPATGRILAGVPEEILRLPFIRYLILANGANVYDRVAEKMLYTAEIPLPEALEVLTWLDGFPVIYDCYQENQGYMTADMWARADRYAPSPVYLHMIRTLRRPVPELKAFLRAHPGSVQKLQAFCETTEVQQHAMKETALRFPDLAVSSSIARNIEINAAQANKGSALEALCASLGLSAEDAAAFGDGSNDLTMIRAAGLGVAMQNSIQAVLDASDQITLSNEEDGVGRAIEDMLSS